MWTDEARDKSRKKLEAIGYIYPEMNAVPLRPRVHQSPHGLPDGLCSRGLHPLSGDNEGWHKRPNRHSDRFCKACEREQRKQARLKRHDHYKQVANISQKRTLQKDRDAVFEAYGNQCSCCGETERRFLSVEHIGRWGAAHRKRQRYTFKIYREIIAQGFPKDKFTIYCMNCNWAERWGEPCPHKAMRKGEVA